MFNSELQRKRKENLDSDSKTALTAVAFQDHLLRSIGKLSLSDPLQQRRLPGLKPKNYKKEVKAVVNTRRGKPATKKDETKTNEREYVLDPKPPPLTLAQKLGLIEGPKALLTENEWTDVKKQSNEREDSKEPCVICKEDFGVEQQVLLSCSHVFHRTCLEAFERFSGKKTCPMCRREQYQMRVIHEGAREWRHKCATLIQAQWRGYVVRCWYSKLRQTVPPKDPQLRRKFYEDKLSSITERMVRSLDMDVNAFLTEMDQSLEASRDVFRAFDNKLRVITEEEWEHIQFKAVERGETECPICLNPLETAPCVTSRKPQDKPVSQTTTYQHTPTQYLPPMPQGQGQTKPHLHPNHKNKLLRNQKSSKFSASSRSQGQGQVSVQKTKSDSAQRKGESKRGQVDLDISTVPKNAQMKSKDPEQSGDQTGSPVSSNTGRKRALLSCSHVFHTTCLEAFEELAEGDRKFTCPICRSRYQKRLL